MIPRPLGPLNVLLNQLRLVWDYLDRWLSCVFGETAFNVKDFGAKGDGVTDDTTAIQAAIDFMDSNTISGTLFFPPGTYVIAGALQDTSFSNSQIVLPKRTLAETQFTLALKGCGYPSMLGLGPVAAGVILVSTLGSGTGAMVSVKTSGTLGTSALNLTIEDMTFKMPANPTNSALDFSYVMQPRGFNLRSTTGETFNAWTEPTTATSCAIKMPLNNVPASTYFENTVIDGFRIGVDVNELSRFKNLTIAGCYRALNVHPCIHKAQIEKGLLINNRHDVYAPDTSPTTFAWIDFELDIERATTAVHGAVWFVGVDEINDAQNYLNGPIITHLDLPFGQIWTNDTLLIVGGQYVQTIQFRVWTTTFTNLTVGNGTVVARYFKHRKHVSCELAFTFGSTSAVSGDIRFSLPVPVEPQSVSLGGVMQIGAANCFDVSQLPTVDIWNGQVNLFSATVAAIRFNSVSGSLIKPVFASSSFPITWATGDEIRVKLDYESEW